MSLDLPPPASSSSPFLSRNTQGCPPSFQAGPQQDWADRYDMQLQYISVENSISDSTILGMSTSRSASLTLIDHSPGKCAQDCSLRITAKSEWRNSSMWKKVAPERALQFPVQLFQTLSKSVWVSLQLCFTRNKDIIGAVQSSHYQLWDPISQWHTSRISFVCVSQDLASKICFS